MPLVPLVHGWIDLTDNMVQEEDVKTQEAFKRNLRSNVGVRLASCSNKQDKFRTIKSAQTSIPRMHYWFSFYMILIMFSHGHFRS